MPHIPTDCGAISNKLFTISRKPKLNVSMCTKYMQNVGDKHAHTEVQEEFLYYHFEDEAFKLFKCTFPGFNL